MYFCLQIMHLQKCFWQYSISTHLSTFQICMYFKSFEKKIKSTTYFSFPFLLFRKFLISVVRLGFYFGAWNKKFHNWFSQEYSHRNRQPKGSKGKTIDNKYCVKTQQEFYVWGFPPSIKLDCDCIYHRHETWDNKYINWWNKRNQSGRYIK